MSVAILTDSTADLPPALLEALGIAMVPLSIRLGEAVFRDHLDLNAADFFARAAAERVRPFSSQPPVGAFIAAYRRLLEHHDSIISIHIAATFSGTCDNARLAAQELAGRDITVVDSRSFTLGLSLQVAQAARASREGRGREEILAWLAQAIRGTVIYGVLDDLDYLRLGGRITRVAHLLGTFLKVKPVIEVRDGLGNTLANFRRRDKALANLFARLEPVLTSGGKKLGIMYTGAAAAAEELRRQVEERFGPVELLAPAGPVVGCHVGPGALGVAIVPEYSGLGQ